MQETRVQSLGLENPLEKGMATHSSIIIAWRISWTEKPGGLQSMGSYRVGHNWASNTHTHTHNTNCDPPRFPLPHIPLPGGDSREQFGLYASRSPSLRVCTKNVSMYRPWGETNWIWVPALLLISCVTLGKLFKVLCKMEMIISTSWSYSKNDCVNRYKALKTWKVS